MSDSKLIIDVRGTQSGNKGAQLMLEAVAERYGSLFTLTAQTHLTDYDVRSRLGLRQTLHLYRAPRLSPVVSDLLPARVRRPYGLVSDSEIAGVLDASGFAYSDQWGPNRAETEVMFGRRQFRRGVPKVLLPQAFGPFSNVELRKWASELFEQSSVVFARDHVSEKYIRGLNLRVPIERSPDFTIGLSASATDLPITTPFIAIVPNARIVDRGGQSRDAYFEGLKHLSLAARAEGLDPLVVVHETQDLALAKRLAETIDSEIYTNPEPRELKFVLGNASAVITSRFHALVGALSQGVPALAWGWSHKYVELLKDFDVPEWIITAEEADPAGRVTALLNDTAARDRLESARPNLVAKVDTMWEITEDALRSRHPTRVR
ncbi:polysaccharide pyruvyl transferase family protein [Microbacterium dauci]|uniref:Polysaccharide pyruvyl transferase family protein n=1 Tax=Microbacterium dauci TaxID=3048008 RepID=A0ABT6ZE71_9MICO|nr:polysaccharide pyruvyl transferase family protein [Microbacterium sp. LX3-4]MDJ1114461.1 polysaccharide pyruvyl transferase family protein [Microbacterium sp. LX3-4]